jgi:hypothetical protein
VGVGDHGYAFPYFPFNILTPAVLDFIIFDAADSFIFGMFIPLSFVAGTNAILVHRSDDRKPTFHVQTCHEILSENFHFPTQPDPSILYQAHCYVRSQTCSEASRFPIIYLLTHTFHSNGHNHCE